MSRSGKARFGFAARRTDQQRTLFLDPAPKASTVRAVFQQLRAEYRIHRLAILSIAPALQFTEANVAMLHGLGFQELRSPGWCSSRLDLTEPDAVFRKNLDQKWRNRLCLAERSGLELTISQASEDFEWLLHQHERFMRSKGFRGLSVDFVRSYRTWQPRDCFVFQARFEGKPIGGIAVARFGRTAEGLVLVCDEGCKFNSGNFLFWNVAAEMKRRGCWWFDLGGHGYKPGRFKHFKEGMGGDEYRMVGEWASF